MKVINLLFPLRDFLYILQLEEYEVSRYTQKLKTALFKRNFEVRDTLKFTSRIKLTILISLLFLASILSTLISSLAILGAVLFVAMLPLLTPFAVAVASLFISIPATLSKKYKIKAASHYFKSKYPNVKVIAITGSFGKTTTKYLLQHVLQYDLKTAIIPDNINTGIGIANYILANKIPKDCQILVVEMAAYTVGDIRESALAIKPDISILTVLGDQHMERFGNFAKLVKGKAEIFTTHSSQCYTTETVASILKEHNIGTETLVTVPDTGDSIEIVKAVAGDLGISSASVENSISTFKNPSRRNDTYTKDNVLIIDNSYNISPMIAEKLLTNAAETAQSHNKQLVVMTGGIGEQAPNNKKVNETFAFKLNATASRVILNPTTYAKGYIAPKLTVPYVYADNNRTVVDAISDHVDGDTEALLWLTGQTDLEYI